MAEIYKNIKTGVKAELIEINEKSKQVTLKKLADGKLTSTLMGSFEKYWKKIDGDATSEKKPAKTAPKKEVEKPVEETAKAEEVKKEESKAEKPKKEKAEKPKKEKKPKKEDKQVISTVIKTLDELKVTHKESWQNKGTAVYVGKIRVFECWKRMERVRINYNPDLTALNSHFASKEEDKREKSHLSVTVYVNADNIPNAIKELVKNMKSDRIEELLNKKEEKKLRKEKSEKSEKNETKKSKKVETEEK